MSGRTSPRHSRRTARNSQVKQEEQEPNSETPKSESILNPDAMSGGAGSEKVEERAGSSDARPMPSGRRNSTAHGPLANTSTPVGGMEEGRHRTHAAQHNKSGLRPHNQYRHELFIFLSYHWSDKEAASQIRDSLQHRGFRVVSGSAGVPLLEDNAGDKSYDNCKDYWKVKQISESTSKSEYAHIDHDPSSQLRLAVRESAVVVCLFSAAYSACLHCGAELAYAIGGDKPITPVTLESNFEDQEKIGTGITHVVNRQGKLTRLPPVETEQNQEQNTGRVAKTVGSLVPSPRLTMGRVGWVLQKYKKIDFSAALDSKSFSREHEYEDQVENLVVEINTNWRHRKA